MANIGLAVVKRIKQSQMGIGPWKVATPMGLIAIGVVGFIASFLLAAILKWFGLASVVIGLVLMFWPTD